MLISRSKTFKPNKLLKDEWSVDEVEQRYRGFSIEKQNFTFFRPFSANFPPFYRFRHFFRHKNLSATRLFYRTLLRKMAEKSDTWTLCRYGISTPKSPQNDCLNISEMFSEGKIGKLVQKFVQKTVKMRKSKNRNYKKTVH